MVDLNILMELYMLEIGSYWMVKRLSMVMGKLIFLGLLQMNLEMKNTMVIGKMIWCMGMVLISIHLELFILDNGLKGKWMERELWSMLMDQVMKENGKIIWCMEMVFILTKSKSDGKEYLLMEHLNQRFKRNYNKKN